MKKNGEVSRTEKSQRRNCNAKKKVPIRKKGQKKNTHRRGNIIAVGNHRGKKKVKQAQEEKRMTGV